MALSNLQTKFWILWIKVFCVFKGLLFYSLLDVKYVELRGT